MVMDWKRVGNYEMMWMFREDWGGEGGKGVRGGKRDGKGWWNGGMNKRIVCKNEMNVVMISSLCMYTLHNPRQ